MVELQGKQDQSNEIVTLTHTRVSLLQENEYYYLSKDDFGAMMGYIKMAFNCFSKNKK